MNRGTRSAMVAALQMLRGRAVRTALMILQFTVGFCALVVLAVLVSQAQAVTHATQASFATLSVLGLYPQSRPANANPVLDQSFLASHDLAELERLPGVDATAILLGQTGYLPGEKQIRFYAINRTAEELLRVRILERVGADGPAHISDGGAGWIFLTPAAYRQLAGPDGAPPSELSVRIFGKQYQFRVAGTAAPPVGWPTTTTSVGAFDADAAALVIDFAAISEQVWERSQVLANALWLRLAEGADAEAVGRTLATWYAEGHPDTGVDMGSLSVAAEVAQHTASRQPGTWAAAILSVLFLLMAGLGFAGQTMLLADSRRTEWALRLALGASRTQLMIQVFVETAVIVAAAAGLSLGAVAPFVPTITRSLGGWQEGRWVGVAGGAIVLAALVICGLASAYPLRRAANTETSTILKESW